MCINLNSVIAQAASAEELAVQMMDYYESKEYTEDDYANIQAGLQDEDTVRLLGILVSNFMQVGMEVDIEDTAKLAETLAEPINNNVIKDESLANAYASVIAMNITTSAQGVEVRHIKGESRDRISDTGKSDEIIFRAYFDSSLSKYFTDGYKLVRFEKIDPSKATGKKFDLADQDGDGTEFNTYYKYDDTLELAGSISDDKGIYGVKLKTGTEMTSFQLLSRFADSKYQYLLVPSGTNVHNKIYKYRQDQITDEENKQIYERAWLSSENITFSDGSVGHMYYTTKSTKMYEDEGGKATGCILSLMNVDEKHVIAAGDYMDEMLQDKDHGGPIRKSSKKDDIKISLNKMLCGYFQSYVTKASSPENVSSVDRMGTTVEYPGEGSIYPVFNHNVSNMDNVKLNQNSSYIGAHQYDEFYVEGTDNIVWSSGSQSCRAIGSVLRNKLITTGSKEALKACTGITDAKDKDIGKGNIEIKNIAVDCFGDIWITDGKGKGYLAVPGCANPYTFSNDGTVAPLNNLHMMGYLYSNDFKSSSAFVNTNNFTSACIRRFDKSRYIVDTIMTNASVNNESTKDFFTSGSDSKKTYVRQDIGGKDFRASWQAGVTDGWFILPDKDEYVRSMGFSLAPGVIEVYGNNSAMAYKKGSYSNAYTEEMKTFDLIAFGGVWDEDGQVVPLIADGDKGLGKSQTFLEEATATADKYGNVEIKETKKATFIYGLYLMYAFAVTGQDIEIDKNNYEQDINVTVKTSEWGACDNLPNVITDISQYQDLLDDMLKNIKSAELDEKKGNIIDALFKILNPEEAWGYITNLVNQRASEICLGWHYSLLGMDSNTDNSALSGTNNYSTSNGYVSAPRVNDIAVTNYLVDNYDTIVVVALMVILVIMLVYILLSMKTVQRAILGIVIFGVCLYIVPIAMSTVVDITNSIGNALIDDKFQYWTITQHQSFIEDLRKAEEEDDSTKYLSEVNAELAAFSTNSTAVATVQWMSPKKDNYINQILGIMQDGGDTESNSLIANKSIFSIGKQIGTKTLSGQKYVDGNATYLYRSYSDISSSASRVHQAVEYKSTNDSNVGSLKYFDTLSFAKDGSTNEAKLDLQQREDMKSGYKVTDRLASDKYKKEYPDDTLNRFRILTTSDTVNDSLTKYISRVSIDANNVTDYTTGKFAYGFSVNYDDKDLKPSTLAKVYKSNDSENYSLDKLAEYQFLTYTESPFYYFYDALGDRGTLKGGNSAYKSFILKDENITTSKIKNDDGESCVRDYMDMEGFFKYTLPYMRQATDVVTDFDKLYTMNVYSTILDANADLTALKDNPDYAQELSKIWHNAQVGRLWNLYSSWVNTMEECDYADEDTFTTMVDGAQMRVTVKDPLNPASYKKMRRVGDKWYGRDMIFSEEQMVKAGLKYNQLSRVEKKIVDIGIESSKDMYNLMNYYTYDDQVLTTAAAMFYTFNFNQAFSQTNLVKGDKILYPQGFATENMSYDTYLRMTLINSTGLSISGQGSSGVYETVVSNTNAFVAILMILNDILAVYVITNLKIILVVVMLFLGVLSILCKITVNEFELLKTFKNSVIVPLVKFFAITLCHCFVASILIGNIQTNIIKNKGISSGITSPVTILLVLLVIHILLVFLYGKLCIKVVKDLVSTATNILSNVGGAFARLGGGLVAATGATAAGKAVANATGRGIKRFTRSGSSNRGSIIARDSKAMNKYAKSYNKKARKKRNSVVAGKVNSLIGGTTRVVGNTAGKVTSKTRSSASIVGRGVYSKTSLSKLRQQEREIQKQRAMGVDTSELESSLAKYRSKHKIASGVSKSANFVGGKYRTVKGVVGRAADRVGYTATAPVRGVKSINRSLNNETKRRNRRKAVRASQRHVNRQNRVNRYFR